MLAVRTPGPDSRGLPRARGARRRARAAAASISTGSCPRARRSTPSSRSIRCRRPASPMPRVLHRRCGPQGARERRARHTGARGARWRAGRAGGRGQAAGAQRRAVPAELHRRSWPRSGRTRWRCTGCVLPMRTWRASRKSPSPMSTAWRASISISTTPSPASCCRAARASRWPRSGGFGGQEAISLGEAQPTAAAAVGAQRRSSASRCRPRRCIPSSARCRTA